MEALGAISLLGAVADVWNIADICIQVSKAPETVVIFTRLVKQVIRDLDQAYLLRDNFKEELIKLPHIYDDWIENVMDSTKAHLKTLTGVLPENLEADFKNLPPMTMFEKMKHLLDDGPFLEKAQAGLCLAHSRLICVINLMNTVAVPIAMKKADAKVRARASSTRPASQSTGQVHSNRKQIEGSKALVHYQGKYHRWLNFQEYC